MNNSNKVSKLELIRELEFLIEYLESMSLGDSQECLNAKALIAKARGDS